MDEVLAVSASHAKPSPLLILAWGNLSRGDDALGPLFLQRLQASLAPELCRHIEFLDDHQLQIEHALDLVGRVQVLLVDASLDCAAPFEIMQVQPSRDASFTTHSLSPQALLQVYQDLQGEPPPPCRLLAIRGECFELGAPPGANASSHLDAALQWAQQDLTAACINFGIIGSIKNEA